MAKAICMLSGCNNFSCAFDSMNSTQSAWDNLHHRISGKLGTEVDVYVRLIEGLDGNGLGVLPSNHLQHHLVTTHVGQFLDCAYCLYSDLQCQTHYIMGQAHSTVLLGCG